MMRKRSRRGIALIDLVVAVLITGIVAAISMPKIATVYNARRAEAAARMVASDLNYLRRQAITGSKSVTVSLDSPRGIYSSPDAPSLDGTTGTFQRELYTWVPGVKIKRTGTDTTMRFDMRGRPFSSGGTALSAAALVVSSNDHQWQVSIDASGKAQAHQRKVP